MNEKQGEFQNGVNDPAYKPAEEEDHFWWDRWRRGSTTCTTLPGADDVMPERAV